MASEWHFKCAGPVIGLYGPEDVTAQGASRAGQKKHAGCGQILDPLIFAAPSDGQTRAGTCPLCGTVFEFRRVPEGWTPPAVEAPVTITREESPARKGLLQRVMDAIRG